MSRGYNGEVAGEPLDAFGTQLNTASSCYFLKNGFEKVAARLWWVTDELLHVKAKLETLHSDLGTAGQLHEDLVQLHKDLGAEGTLAKDLTATLKAELPGVTAEHPLQVSSTGGEGGSSEVVAVLEEGDEALHHALWFLIGVVVCQIVAFGIWRTGAIRG
jgi:hypothetical protein